MRETDPRLSSDIEPRLSNGIEKRSPADYAIPRIVPEPYQARSLEIPSDEEMKTREQTTPHIRVEKVEKEDGGGRRKTEAPDVYFGMDTIGKQVERRDYLS